MSVIDRALQGLQGTSAEPLTLSVPEALAAILVASVSIDGALSLGESARMEGILSTSRLFGTASGTGNAGSVERAIALLNQHDMAAVLTACANALPPELHATALLSLARTR